MSKVNEQFKLNIKFMNISRKLAIVSVIGLSISIAMISQNILFLDSFRNSAFDEFAVSFSSTHIDTRLEKIKLPGMAFHSLLELAVINEIRDIDINSDILAYQEWVTYRFFYLLLYNEITLENEFHDTYVIGIDESHLNLLAPLISEGEAPSLGEFCLITKTKTIEETNVALNDTFNAYIQINEYGNPWESYSAGIGAAGQVISFSGIINLDNVTFGSLPIPDELRTIFSVILSLGKELIITDFYTLPFLLTSMSLSLNEFSTYGRIVFDLQKFNVFQLDTHIAQLHVFINNLHQALLNVVYNSPNLNLIINPYILSLLSLFKREYRIFQTFILLFMLPTLGMSLALTMFASNQVRRQRDQHIVNFHQRGASRGMLFRFMLFELLIFSLIGALIGFLIGWPYTMVALKSDSFFSFNSEASFPTPNFKIIALCLGAGFAIVWFSNIFSLWQKTKTSIDETLQEKNEKKPFWERFYIDILLLVLGLMLWFISYMQIEGTGQTALEFAFYFATPAPILIIIGGIMFVTRIYPVIIRSTSNIMFKIPTFELSAISARNVIRRRDSTTRTIILLTLTFALTIATMIVPDSYQAYDYENAYYNLGADIVVEDVDVVNPEYKQQVEAIEGVEATSYVGVLDLTNTEGNLLYTIRILGVELASFGNVAFQEPEYTDKVGIEVLLQSITQENDVLGQPDQIKLLNLGVNNTFIIKNWALIGGDVVEVFYPVHVVNYYFYWPTVYMQKPAATSKEVKIGLLANISLPFLIARNNYDVEGKLYVKVREGYSAAEVARLIELNTQHKTNNIENSLLISAGTLKATVLFGSLNSSVLVSILISSATLITMMFIQGFEREKDIAIMKACGINGRQLFRFFITEAIVILIFTMIIGIVVGLGASAMIMKILRIGAVLPEHEMVFPIIKLLWTTLTIFGCGLISTIIPITINTHKKIGGSLKAV